MAGQLTCPLQHTKLSPNRQLCGAISSQIELQISHKGLEPLIGSSCNSTPAHMLIMLIKYASVCLPRVNVSIDPNNHELIVTLNEK